MRLVCLKFSPSRFRSGTMATGRFCRAIRPTSMAVIRNFRRSQATNRNNPTAAIFDGAFVVNFWTTPNILVSLGIASGNTLEALCGALLVNRLAGGARVLDRPQDVFKFALAAIISTTLSPSLGVSSLALGGFAQ